MISLKIDNILVKVNKGETVLKAAQKIGISIPTMCHLEGHENHPSCMLCLVKDSNTGKLFPSCAMPAQENMEIISYDEEIEIARRQALELLLSDHVGDCEAPCRPSCPAFMNIPKMNRLIANNQFDEAIKVVKEDIALPLILGYICPAPCEKACRRTQIDEAVSICQLKKSVALENLTFAVPYVPEKKKKSGKKIAIIGSGPAGLSAAFYTLWEGHQCDVYDKNPKIGGTLEYEILENKLPKKALQQEIDLIKNYGANFILDYEINKTRFENEIKPKYDAIILATGDYSNSKIETFGFETTNNGIKIDKNTYSVNENGIFACGNIVRTRRMSINSVAQGKIAALSASQFVKGEKIKKRTRNFNSKFGKLLENEYFYYKKEGTDNAKETLPKIENLPLNQAIAEAKRCMHCDCRKSDDCKLRIYSIKYSANQSQFAYTQRKQITKDFTHERIIFEPEKCIKCNLCVDICKKAGEKFGFTASKRGFNVEIQVPFSSELSLILDETAIKCAKHCPTGAISIK
jgi:NADPH-dependent glutamate synthase beta subunit-like oxidoreductase/NAD-dependent dihydropyrimidine dehydrogenase PreA subunit